jgi:spermidine/putrescine transport system substrate-binding protein
MLTEMSDTIGCVMLENGDDPSHVDSAAFDRALRTVQRAVKSGQIRQFSGNDYAPLLANGDVWASLARSGDIAQLQDDNASLHWLVPKAGGMIWTDNMLVPRGGDVYTASVFMNFVYRPAVAAEITDYVNYVCPVVGADRVLAKIDPKVARNPLVFPSKRMLTRVHSFDTRALSNQDYMRRFQHVVGA